jgi:hypothetical protein
MRGILTQRSTKLGALPAKAQTARVRRDTRLDPRPDAAEVPNSEAYFSLLGKLTLEPDESVPKQFFIGCASVLSGVDSDRKNEKLYM